MDPRSEEVVRHKNFTAITVQTRLVLLLLVFFAKTMLNNDIISNNQLLIAYYRLQNPKNNTSVKRVSAMRATEPIGYDFFIAMESGQSVGAVRSINP